jgi:hypothetical protein
VLVLEVAIMSNYLWTEKQIMQGINRVRAKKDADGWLGTEVFRTPTKDVQGKKADNSDYRLLMKEIVERDEAFDNKKTPDSAKYRISGNWDLRDRLLADSKPLKHFSPGVLADPTMGNLPILSAFDQLHKPKIEAMLGRPLTAQDQYIWVEAKSDWTIIYEALCNYQSTSKFKVGSYANSLGERKKWLIKKAEEVACIYKALEVGFDEIKKTTYCPNFYVPQYFLHCSYDSHEELFLAILRRQATCDFIIRCLHPGSLTPLADSRKIATIDNFFPVVAQLFRPASKNENWYVIQDQVTDLRRASRSLMKAMPERLQDLATAFAGEMYFHRGLLQYSDNPEVLNAIQKWAEASNQANAAITKGLLRKRSKKTY